MTSINRLTQKTNLTDSDIVPIWDSESSRTRAVTFATMKSNLIYVSDITAGTGTLIIHYSDGTQKELTL